MNKVISFIAILLFSFTGYSYSVKDLNLSSFEFRRYLRPQLISIINDYYTILTIYNKKAETLKAANSQFQKLYNGINRLPLKCSKENLPKCSFEIESLKKHTLSILKNKKHPLSINDDILSYGLNFLNLSTLNQDFEKDLHNFYFKLQQVLLSLNSFETIKIEKLELTSSLSRMQNTHNLLYLEAAPEEVRDVLILFWSSFVKICSQKIIPNSDQPLFEKKINELNLSINHFLQFMTKRNDLLNGTIKKDLDIIHRRWTNVMKLSIR